MRCRNVSTIITWIAHVQNCTTINNPIENGNRNYILSVFPIDRINQCFSTRETEPPFSKRANRAKNPSGNGMLIRFEELSPYRAISSASLLLLLLLFAVTSIFTIFHLRRPSTFARPRGWFVFPSRLEFALKQRVTHTHSSNARHFAWPRARTSASAKRIDASHVGDLLSANHAQLRILARAR